MYSWEHIQYLKKIKKKRDNMKYFILCILVCIGGISCILRQNARNKNTTSIPEEIYAHPFNYSKKWDDYSTNIKPYNVLDMTNKSVTEINQLYGKREQEINLTDRTKRNK